ncbi:MAG: epimerase [Spirochaetes bacterium]|jgi:uncharacterized protein YbjT (DUF2867 family)|nr:epimerase [Spirochaetota bacterium]
MKLKVIVTGATGMVGEGVLHECLLHEEVGEALVIGRRPCGVAHPKLKEIVHENFYDFSPIADRLAGYDACFFCLGKSSVGMKEDEYRRLTYDLTMHVAGALCGRNPGMVFCYVSGLGTDGTEKGKFMWARIKGKTENDLMKMPFKCVYAFRPGFMRPTKGLKNAPVFYRAMMFPYPLLRLLFPAYVSTLAELGCAMINSALYGYDKQVLEVRDIVALSKGNPGPSSGR